MGSNENMSRESWGSKIGLILAMAGNAVGLGNFWKFPYVAARYGGGAFMLPYFLSILVIGLPVMLVEWNIGRTGGQYGEGTLGPMIYLEARRKLKPKTALKIGAFCGGLCFAVALLINSYYSHIVGWTLNYFRLSLNGAYMDKNISTATLFVDQIANPVVSIGCWIISLILVGIAVSLGVQKGIEKMAKIMMPTLYIFAIILAIRVLTLGAPVTPEWSALKGLNYIWNPDFGALSFDAAMAAAGQVFYSCSLGMGLVVHYSSFLKPDDDVVVSSVSTISLNEFAEIVLAGTIVIPMGYAYLGEDILKSAGAGLTFITLPNAFRDMAMGGFFGGLWFLVLFFAGFTSSMALYSYVTTFVQETTGCNRKKASFMVMLLLLVTGLPVGLEPIINKVGATYYLDEVDLWIGQYFLLILGLIELMVVGYCAFERNYSDVNQGALWRVPKSLFRVMVKYVSPIAMVILILGATIQRVTSGAFALFPVRDNNGGFWMIIGRIMMLIIFLIGSFITHKYIRIRYEKEINTNIARIE